MRNFIKRKSFLYEIKYLRKSILSSEDLIFFDEAIKCFSQKAYRASYIIVWICAAESLKSKIKELSLKDVESGIALKEIQKCEKQNFSSDKLILDKSYSLGLIDKDQYKKLDYIRDMRNLYAHPLCVGPNLEEIIVAFSLVREYILSRPAQLKHGYVQNLLKSIYKNRYFLDDDNLKINEYAIGIANRLHPKVIPYLFENACKFFEETTEEIIRRRAIYFIIALLESLKPEIDDNDWGIINIINQYPEASSLFLSSPIIWLQLPEQAKDMCFNYLVEPVDDNNQIIMPSVLYIEKLKSLFDNNLFDNKKEERFKEILTKSSYDYLIAAGISLNIMADRILSELKSYNWHIQNPAIQGLINFGIDKIDALDDINQLELGRNILQTAEGDSGSALKLIKKLAEDKIKLPFCFVDGLLKECLVNEKFEFRFKKHVFKDVFKIVLVQQSVKDIISSTIKDIEKSKPSFLSNSNDYDASVLEINEIEEVASDVDKMHINKLKESINNAKLLI